MKRIVISLIWVIIQIFILNSKTYGQILTANGPTTFCAGDSVVLSVPAQANMSYIWLRDTVIITGQQTNQLVATSTGNYRVIRSSAANCCDTSNSISVQVNVLPVATINHTGTIYVCFTFAAPLLETTAAPGNTYQWFKDNLPIQGATSSTYQLTAPAAGLYHVVVTNASNCQQTSASLNVISGPPPVTVTISSNAVACTGSALISATGTAIPGAVSYQWYRDGVFLPNNNVNPFSTTVSGDFYVSVHMGSGCLITSNTLRVLVSNPPPSPTITALGSTSLCGNSSVNLTVGSGYFVSWFKDGAPFNSGISMTTISVNSPGTYRCTVTSWSPPGSGIPQCSATSTNSIVITSRPIPDAPILSIRADTIFSNLDSILQWYRNGIQLLGRNDPFLVVNQGGNYNATQIQNGCRSDTSNSIFITNVSVEAKPRLAFKLYPNPSNGRFKLEYKGSYHDSARLRIYNLYGKLVMEGDLPTDLDLNSFEIDLEEQVEGIYLIEILQGQNIGHQRLVLRR